MTVRHEDIIALAELQEEGYDVVEDDDIYQALYEHYLNNGEMPYGVAKARTGDPAEWISEALAFELKSRTWWPKHESAELQAV